MRSASLHLMGSACCCGMGAGAFGARRSICNKQPLSLPHLCYNTCMTTDFADLLRRIPGYAHQIAHVQPLPPRAARFAAPLAPLPAALADALEARGITQLYA